MNTSHFTNQFTQDLQRLATLGGPELESAAERLGALMIPILQQRMLEQFGALVTEYNQAKNRNELELRVANNEIHIVSQAANPEPAAEAIGDLDARFALRLPSDLKTRIDAMATVEGISTNSWVVRTLSTATVSRSAHTYHTVGQTLRGRGRS